MTISSSNKLLNGTGSSSLLGRLCQLSTALSRSGISTTMPNAFYAVRVGRAPGIYKTWKECQDQVTQFSGAQFKKFKTIQEAQKFMESVATGGSKVAEEGSSGSAGGVDEQDDYDPRSQTKRPNPYFRPKDSFLSKRETYNLPYRKLSTVAATAVRETSDLDRIADSPGDSGETSSSSRHHPDNVAVVFTDGCCHNNGQKGAVAGIGVYWGKDSPHNVAEHLPGRPTNNRAEIHAAVKAILQAKSLAKTKIIVNTDSQFLINSITLWLPSWRNNNWKLGGGGQVVNRLDFETLLVAMEGIEVEWIHVRGHQGIWGNEEADRLANEGARKEPPPSQGIPIVTAPGALKT